MCFLISVLLSLLVATIVTAAPTTSVALESLNFPAGSLDAILKSRSEIEACPRGENSCGVVTFKSGQYVSFGQGTCMQLGKNVQSIYVAKCFCSLWNTCTSNSKKNVYVGGMMMCEKPKTMDEFSKEVKYLSCGGMK